MTDPGDPTEPYDYPVVDADLPFYGEAPADLGHLHLPQWHEFMHYLYVPVRVPWSDRDLPGGLMPDSHKFERNDPWSFPPEMRFLAAVALGIAEDARLVAEHLADPYVYITARRGYATPGNPLNRPGWHCDDFGGTDLNYIWTNAYPTRFLVADDDYLNISEDDAQSMTDMENHARWAEQVDDDPDCYDDDDKYVRIEDGPTEHLLRLSPYVVHTTPDIEPPGGLRSFFKISVSTHRYDLLGNSHNHGLDYSWPMFDRETLRNQPTAGNRDYSGATT